MIKSITLEVWWEVVETGTWLFDKLGMFFGFEGGGKSLFELGDYQFEISGGAKVLDISFGRPSGAKHVLTYECDGVGWNFIGLQIKTADERTVRTWKSFFYRINTSLGRLPYPKLEADYRAFFSHGQIWNGGLQKLTVYSDALRKETFLFTPPLGHNDESVTKTMVRADEKKREAIEALNHKDQCELGYKISELAVIMDFDEFLCQLVDASELDAVCRLFGDKEEGR
jgi:hypothetical protein